MKELFPNVFTKFKGGLTISRPSSHDNVDRIRLTARDEDSRVTIFECEIDPGDLMIAITGLADRPITGKVNTSGVVGKIRVDERVSVVVPNVIGNDRAASEKYLIEKCQPPGWYVDAYLGSQSARQYNHADGTYTLNFRIFRYVDETED